MQKTRSGRGENAPAPLPLAQAPLFSRDNPKQPHLRKKGKSGYQTQNVTWQPHASPIGTGAGFRQGVEKLLWIWQNVLEWELTNFCGRKNSTYRRRETNRQKSMLGIDSVWWVWDGFAAGLGRGLGVAGLNGDGERKLRGANRMQAGSLAMEPEQSHFRMYRHSCRVKQWGKFWKRKCPERSNPPRDGVKNKKSGRMRWLMRLSSQ